jgi:outer membrane protein assembly factor BamB
MFRPLFKSLALVFALSLTICSVGRSQARAGDTVQPLVAGLDPENFRRVWMNIMPVDSGDQVNRIYVDKNIIFVASLNNVFYVQDRSTGVMKYFRYVDGGGRQVRTPVVTQSYIVYLGQTNLEVYKPTGDFVKSIQLGFTISSEAVAHGDELYLGADLAGGQLADVNISAPYRNVHWRLIMDGEMTGKPSFYKDIIYAGSGSGGIKAVTPERTAGWSLEHDQYQTDGPILGDVIAEESGVYAASVSGRLVCLDRNNGHLKWQYIAPHPLYQSPVVTATTVYQFVPQYGLAAIDKNAKIAIDADGRRKIDAANREARWVCPDAVQFVSEDEAFTYVRTVTGEIWALDHDTGQVRYRGTGVHFAAVATNVTDNIIYASTRDGVVYAIRPALAAGSPGYLQ